MWIEENKKKIQAIYFVMRLNFCTSWMSKRYAWKESTFFLFGLIYMSISFELKIHLDLEHDEFNVKIGKTAHAKPRYAMIWH